VPQLYASSFELHDNALALHEYTRHERKIASGFDGELDNFQEPELSSLAKLVRVQCIMVRFYALIDRMFCFFCIEYGRYPAAMISYAPSDSLVDKQGKIAKKIAQEFYPLGHPPANAKPIFCLVFFSTKHGSNNSNMNVFSDGPTVVPRPRVLGSCVGDFTQKRPRAEWATDCHRGHHCGGRELPCGHSIMIVYYS
jgi:hypothetical protein